ncbi:MAG: hypothetical protein QHH80_12400 [Anaerolineae bacterium]|nr:hypothetical protein [Anaerolineae bacterium]
MAQEFREIYGNIPGVVRGLFRDAQKAQSAAEGLLAMGVAPRDLQVVPITPPEQRKYARPMLEILGIRKPKREEKKEATQGPGQFKPGDVVVLVRLREWTRDRVEKALLDMGADELAYFPPPGEGEVIGAKVAPARPTYTRPGA